MQSKLTDYQLKSMIYRCGSAALMYEAEGKHKQATVSRAKADAYREELAGRQRGESKQVPQEFRHNG